MINLRREFAVLVSTALRSCQSQKERFMVVWGVEESFFDHFFGQQSGRVCMNWQCGVKVWGVKVYWVYCSCFDNFEKRRKLRLLCLGFMMPEFVNQKTV